jgi:hypothetical protein
MYFDGLLKKIGHVDVESILSEISGLFDTGNINKFQTTIKEFNESKWAVLEIAYADPTVYASYISPTKSYYDIIERVIEFIGKNYYVVHAMIAWVTPGQKIEKHVDLQDIYTKTRRIHVQLIQNTESFMSVWAGEVEHKVNIKPGAIYELNNRAYHAVSNLSSQHTYAILVLDLGIEGHAFTKEDNTSKNLDLQSSTGLPLWI